MGDGIYFGVDEKEWVKHGPLLYHVKLKKEISKIRKITFISELAYQSCAEIPNEDVTPSRQNVELLLLEKSEHCSETFFEQDYLVKMLNKQRVALGISEKEYRKILEWTKSKTKLQPTVARSYTKQIALGLMPIILISTAELLHQRKSKLLSRSEFPSRLWTLMVPYYTLLALSLSVPSSIEYKYPVSKAECDSTNMQLKSLFLDVLSRVDGMSMRGIAGKEEFEEALKRLYQRHNGIKLSGKLDGFKEGVIEKLFVESDDILPIR